MTLCSSPIVFCALYTCLSSFSGKDAETEENTRSKNGTLIFPSSCSKRRIVVIFSMKGTINVAADVSSIVSEIQELNFLMSVKTVGLEVSQVRLVLSSVTRSRDIFPLLTTPARDHTVWLLPVSTATNNPPPLSP